jgi:GT2 family glycosyltransferase
MRDFLYNLRLIILPIGSRRDTHYYLIRLFLVNIRINGFANAVRAVFRRIVAFLRGEASLSQERYSYRGWIHDNEPGRRELARQRRSYSAMTFRPFISFLTPVYNPEPDVLRDTLESVLAQTYPNWEYCLANGSELPGVREVLEAYARRDERIRVQHLDRNLGISGNSNAALAMARGEYIALIDHDDLVAPDMLFECAQVLNRQSDADIIYYDEDKISADGSLRLDPWFKPTGWSPDLLLSTNYLMHSVIRRSLVQQAGGFDSNVDGAQDWDLMLRLSRLSPKIVHIPKIFYHWRQVAGSAAGDANAKPWAFPAQARCLEAHLQSLGEPGTKVDFAGLGVVRVRWPVSGAKVSIIIPTKDRVVFLRACLTSIFERTAYQNYEILLVDTGSIEPETLAYYRTLAGEPRLRLIHCTGEFNYHKANNLGASHASGDLLLFLNNDTEALDPEWLEELVGWAERPGVGVVGTKLLYPGGEVQHAGIIVGVEGHGSHIFERLPEHHYGPFGSTDWYRNYTAVTGACMLLPRNVFETLGGFDEVYRVGYGDIDLCLRAVAAGYKVIYTPFARMLHREGGTRGFSQPPSDVLRASVRMMPEIKRGDAYFNPNLSYNYRQPTFARPQEDNRAARLLRILKEFGLVDRKVWDRDEGRDEEERLLPLIENQLEPAEGRKQLLLVTHDLSMTGAPFILSQIGAFLMEKGFAVKVLAPVHGPLESRYQEIGIEVIINPYLLNDAREVLRYLDGVDLLLANTILAWRCIHAARAFKIPCLWWVHESHFGRKFAAENPGVAKAFADADTIVFPSRSTADLYRQFSAGDNFHIIHTGLDPASPGRESSQVTFTKDPGKLYLLNVASLEPRKGQDVLLESLAALPEPARSNVECYLIGHHLDRRFSRRITKAAGRTKNVHVVGELPNAAVWLYMKAADVFVLCSRDEALPLSILEAMSAAKAVVATNAGGVGEVITDGVDGLLVPVEDPQAMAGAIACLYADRQLLERLGQAARSKIMKELTLQALGEQMYSLVAWMSVDRAGEAL